MAKATPAWIMGLPILLAIPFLTWTPTVLAGAVVTQKVETRIGPKTSSATHTWWIDGKKFRLEVEAEGTKTDYIFNGRTFIVCSGLKPEQIAILQNYGLDKKEVETNLQNAGICQNVPSNFMTRFFLNPTSAVGSVDLSDGVKITLALKRYELQPDQTPKQGGCQTYRRQYTFARAVERSGVKSTAGLHLESAISQDICVDPGLHWRDSFWREVSKSVMRQPKSKDLLAQLQKDSAGLKGLAITGSEAFTTTGADGKIHKGNRSWKTISQKQESMAANTFSRPDEFSIYSPKQLSAMVKSDQNQKEGDDRLEKLPAVFFCAMAGPFGCLLSNSGN